MYIGDMTAVSLLERCKIANIAQLFALQGVKLVYITNVKFSKTFKSRLPPKCEKSFSSLQCEIHYSINALFAFCLCFCFYISFRWRLWYYLPNGSTLESLHGADAAALSNKLAKVLLAEGLDGRGVKRNL